MRLTNTELFPEHGEKTTSIPSAASICRSVFKSDAVPPRGAAGSIILDELHLCSKRLFVVALSLWLAGCNNQKPAAHGPPSAEVTVSKPEQKEVVNWNEFTGRTQAVKLVNVSARVSGYIVDIPFKEGDLVHKGDLLFQIDPRPYQHAYEQAVGQLDQAKRISSFRTLHSRANRDCGRQGSLPRKTTIWPCLTRTKPERRSLRLRQR